MIAVKINMPFLLENREIVGAGFCILNEDSNSIILPFKSTMNQKKYLNTEIPLEEKIFKIIDLNFGFMYVIQINEKSCDICVTFNVDPKIPLIP